MVRLVLAALVAVSTLTACGRAPTPEVARAAPALYPGESVQLRALIRQYAQVHGIPEALLHRVIQRESDYNPGARNGPYYGLMQILPQTARTMGFTGAPSDLLDAETNLMWAGRYLRGAYIVADGDIDEAVGWYARGYYYEARDRCLLVETGLRDRELRC
ncbi:lytic transglycosylase domain-containing protein [Wenxinia marina]|uniref:Soluble lytic murein transglycosylase n=1 Tax=Wenxinia marina DSM 24838 TaxID=1123501 RepID=A0A0D0NMM7_9RHOB|nr:lytic transglycosylase domain-containing protein [Wenxinia marina]KIQ69560.1 Soluble lytic murein transglycosylase [Wenxinia marina DSM 24838]GGL59335.1 lytic transglycosylase [Wenxinia marina]